MKEARTRYAVPSLYLQIGRYRFHVKPACGVYGSNLSISRVSSVAADVRAPEFRQDEGHFVQTLWRPTPLPVSSSTTQATPQVITQDKPLLSIALEELAFALGQPTTQVTTQVAEQVSKLLRAAAEPATREQLQDAVGLQNREHFRQTYLEPLLTARWLERTIPDKPTSPHQRYFRTATGAAWLARLPSTL